MDELKRATKLYDERAAAENQRAATKKELGIKLKGSGTGQQYGTLTKSD